MAVAPAAPAPGYGIENQPPPGGPAWRDNLNIHLVCPDCKQDPPDLVEENADTICANCGRVLAERLISYESEWRTFNSDESKGDDPNRVGEAENELLNSNQGTVIGGGGPNISKETRKLKKAQAMQNEDKSNRQLQGLYSIIEQWSEAEHFPSQVKNSAKGFYKRVYDAGTFRGKNVNAVLAGCLFIACRQCKVPRSFAEIMNLTRVPKKEIGRVYKQLEKFLIKSTEDQIKDIESGGGIANHQQIAYTGTTSLKPADLITRFASMIGLQFRVQTIATKLAEKVPSIEQLAGRSPLSTAGACVYFASHLIGKGKSTQEISAVANVSDATIKHAYKFLLAEKERLVEPDWLGPQPTNIKEGGNPGYGDFKNLPMS